MVEAADLTEDEREAIHAVEDGAEWFHRAHGLLIEFHHAVGHAMDHFDDAEAALADGHPGLADRFETEVLPAGLTDEGHLSYQLVAEFEAGVLETVEDVTDRARDELVDGERYVVARAEHADARRSAGTKRASGAVEHPETRGVKRPETGRDERPRTTGLDHTGDDGSESPGRGGEDQ